MQIKAAYLDPLLFGQGVSISPAKPTNPATSDDASDDSSAGASAVPAGETLSSGDRVSISAVARHKAEQLKLTLGDNQDAASEQALDTERENRLSELKERIDEVQSELDNVHAGNISPEEKRERSKALTQELLSLRNELAELQTNNAQPEAGGIPVKGMPNSLT